MAEREQCRIFISIENAPTNNFREEGDGATIQDSANALLTVIEVESPV